MFVCGAPGSGKNYISDKIGLETMGLKQSDIDHTMARLQMLKKIDAEQDIDISYTQAYPLQACQIGEL